MPWSEYQLPLLVLAPLLILLLMYFVRAQSHALIYRLFKSLHHLLRLAARASLHTAQRIRFRNHEVTKALAETLMERQLEKRFMRIERLVERDLDNYQKLAAQINQQLTDIHDDYAASAEVPQPTPEWIAAVEAISNLEDDERNTEVMARILADIHRTVKQHHRDTLREHRWTVSARHKVLSGLSSHWRRLQKLLEKIDHNVDALRHSLRQTDRHMAEFELLTSGSGQGIMSSMFIRFIVAASFFSLGAIAIWTNWQLLQQPFTNILLEYEIGSFSLANIVALVHIGIGLTAAALITDSLKITHFFPLIASMTHRGKRTLLWFGAGLLLLLAMVESMVLVGITQIAAVQELNGLSPLVLMLIGFLMPFAISFVVIPFEYLLHTLRPVIGNVTFLIMNILTLSLKLMARLSIDAGKFFVHCYDAVIFIPLLIEQRYAEQQKRQAEKESEQAKTSEVDAKNVTEIRFGSERR